MKKLELTNLMIFVISAELTGALSGLVSGSFAPLYGELVKPAFSPPGSVFPIVWFILYALMGISAYIIYSADAPYMQKKSALTVYTAQLFVNFIWSIIFFRFENFGLASVTAVLLAVLVLAMVISFGKISKTAALLNVPYLLWTIFAAYLTIGVTILN